jgi:hypothetical protein
MSRHRYRDWIGSAKVKVKVHCRECGLYLGHTPELDFPIHITCPVCEETNARVRAAFDQPIPSTHYQLNDHQSWYSDVMERIWQDNRAYWFIRHPEEYEFPLIANGAQK